MEAHTNTPPLSPVIQAAREQLRKEMEGLLPGKKVWRMDRINPARPPLDTDTKQRLLKAFDILTEGFAQVAAQAWKEKSLAEHRSFMRRHMDAEEALTLVKEAPQLRDYIQSNPKYQEQAQYYSYTFTNGLAGPIIKHAILAARDAGYIDEAEARKLGYIAPKDVGLRQGINRSR